MSCEVEVDQRLGIYDKRRLTGLQVTLPYLKVYLLSLLPVCHGKGLGTLSPCRFPW